MVQPSTHLHQRLLQGMIGKRGLWLTGFLLILSACNPGGAPGGGLYGPAYMPPCTCCCSGDGFIYHRNSASMGPVLRSLAPIAYGSPQPSSGAVSPAAIHDTPGPMANVSANHGSVRARGRTGGRK